MSLAFRYKRVKRPNNIEVKSPSIPVTLSGAGGKYTFVALLDSGADVSAIPEEVAELLGVDLSGKKEDAAGIGGKVPAVQSKLFLEIGKPHETYKFDLPVKVILNKGIVLDGQEIPVLLGRAGFFDKFVIIFDQKEERVTLKRNSNN
ncbi:MAG: retropepsin-like aspartic protease [Nanoarchaeota archaeon]